MMRAAFPLFPAPQLATLVKTAPEGAAWFHETKFDGYRILAHLARGKAHLYTRSGQDWTGRFPGVAASLQALSVRSAWLDGEVAVTLRDGRTSFAALQNAGTLAAGSRLLYYVFDLLQLDGSDLREVPLDERKAALVRLLKAKNPVLRYSSHTAGHGGRAFAQACSRSLEGIISKRSDAPYQSGRGPTWLKVKCSREQEVVIGGFTEPQGTRVGLGALLVGVYDAGGALLYAGKVGTGFSQAAALELRRRLAALERPVRPFAAARGIPRGHYVAPRLVAQVRFTEWTRDGRMRHPAFVGLREDKPAAQVRREEPAS
jgi:bifunctional non-homologous end joining protein LigD